MRLSNLVNKFLPIKIIFLILFSISLKADNCEFKKFNIQLNEPISINEILIQISSMCNYNIIVKDVYANSLLSTTLQSINLRDSNLHTALDLILDNNNIFYKINNNTIYLNGIKTETFVIDYITSVRQGTATLNASVSASAVEIGEERSTTTNSDNEIKVTEEFDFWQTLDTELTNLLNNGHEDYEAREPIINTRAGFITITATKSQLKRASEYLNNLKNRLHKQVLIDVTVVAVKLNNSSNTGINWSNLSLNLDGSIGLLTPASGNSSNSLKEAFRSPFTVVNNSNFSFNGVLDFLQTNGETKVLSSPKVMTLNNQQALITVGDNVNYRVQEDTTQGETGNTQVTYTNYSIFVGVLLNLLPTISDDNKIMLRINPSISDFRFNEDRERQIAVREIAPDTNEKKLSTVAMVNSGDTIILGGLIQNQKGTNTNKVPVLGDIPLLGNLFKGTENIDSTTELVFIITPRIVSLDGSSSYIQSLKDLGYSKSIYE